MYSLLTLCATQARQNLSYEIPREAQQFWENALTALGEVTLHTLSFDQFETVCVTLALLITSLVSRVLKRHDAALIVGVCCGTSGWGIPPSKSNCALFMPP